MKEFENATHTELLRVNGGSWLSRSLARNHLTLNFGFIPTPWGIRLFRIGRVRLPRIPHPRSGPWI